MKIVGIQKFSASDYPATPATVLFTAGCNYDCWFCYNRHIIEERTMYTNLYDEEYVIDLLQKRKKIIQGVVISGGECTLQPDLQRFVDIVKKDLGLKVKIDTNGSNPEVIKKLIDESNIDYVAMDYKCNFNDYNRICGENVNVKKLYTTIDILLGSNIEWELRTTLIPSISSDDIIEMSKRLDHEIPKWIIKRFVGDSISENIIKSNTSKNPAMYEIESLFNQIKANQPNAILMK